MRAPLRLLVTAAAVCAPAALLGSGCFAIADLERFHAGADAGDDVAQDDPTLDWDMTLTMKGMGVHLNQLIEFRIIDSSNYVQTRGVIDPLNVPVNESISFTLPKAIPVDNRPYRLDFYADVNGSRDFDGLDTGIKHDHAWRIAPLADYPVGKFPHVSNLVQVVFTHNKYFTDIDDWPKGTNNPSKDTGLGVLVRFKAASMSKFVGKLVQVRVVETESGHVVGLYRNPRMPGTDFQGFIAGVVEAQVDYDVDVYVDANGNKAYDAPATGGSDVDLGWRLARTAHYPEDGGEGGADAGADAALVGISVDFDPEEKPGIDDVGQP